MAEAVPLPATSIIELPTTAYVTGLPHGAARRRVVRNYPDR
jgi:hypothetical protein